MKHLIAAKSRGEVALELQDRFKMLSWRPLTGKGRKGDDSIGNDEHVSILETIRRNRTKAVRDQNDAHIRSITN